MTISIPNVMKRQPTLCLGFVVALLLLLSGCGSSKKAIPTPDKPTTHHPIPAPVASWTPPLLASGVRQEMRAVWLTTAYGLDWPRTKADSPQGIRRQQAELEKILDRLKADKFNTVFFQARLSGTATYPSRTEPFARVFTSSGEAPDYDPLAFAIEACHRRGLAIHAWVVTYPIVSSARHPHPVVQAHPSWAIGHKGGKHLDPGNPEVRTYIASLSSELARNYNLDGLHFDYFRYPEDADRFDDSRSFARYSGGLDRADWRRENLTEQLVEINDSIQRIRPSLQISVAPLGKLRKIPSLGRAHGWTAYESVYQDPITWARRGLVDFLVPMMYYKDDLFNPFLDEWKALVGINVPVVAGLAPYRVDPSEKYPWSASVIEDQIQQVRRTGVGGVSFFREENISGRLPQVRSIIQSSFRGEAIPLALPKGRLTPPAQPRGLTATPSGGRLRLSWQMPQGVQGLTYRVWVTATTKSGKTESFLISQGLRGQQCDLDLSDYKGDIRLQVGVEAVNSYGVATGCDKPLTYTLS